MVPPVEHLGDLYRVERPLQLALSNQGREARAHNLWERVLDTALLARLRRLTVAHCATADVHFSELRFFITNVTEIGRTNL